MNVEREAVAGDQESVDLVRFLGRWLADVAMNELPPPDAPTEDTGRTG